MHLVLSYTTGEAAGQNMVTLCTEAVCQDILARAPFKPRHWFLEANMSGDKKATNQSLLNTRGRKVVAEAAIPAALVEATLHTTVERLCDYWRMSFIGGAQSGSVGVSGHVANGLAALFLATGQDIAWGARRGGQHRHHPAGADRGGRPLRGRDPAQPHRGERGRRHAPAHGR